MIDLSSSQATAVFQPGELVGSRYRVVRLVGRGGVSEVYEAVDEKGDRRVALKTARQKFRGRNKTAARLAREAELSTRIGRHRNVLEIYRSLEVEPAAGGGATLCLVMELLEGETLADRFGRRGPFTPEAARPLACQIAAGLAVAHRAGVVHRDLKPDNIFLVPDADDGTRVVLTDFGVARFSDSKDESLTSPDVVIGTPEYMAPEQLELLDAEPASDLYTFGLVLFEMVTGERPFQAGTPIEMVLKRVDEDPPSPCEYLPDLDPAWERAILSCLERDPDDRCPSAEAVIRILDGDDSRWLPPSRWHRLRPAAWWLVAAALLLAAGVVLWLR